MLLSEAKVDDLDLGVNVAILQEEVLWLDVAVHEVVVVEVAHCAKDLLHVGCCTPFVKGTSCISAFMLLRLLQNSIEKLTSRAQLHDKVHLLGVQEDLIEFHDVGMVQSGLDVNLRLKSLPIGDLGAIDGLDRPHRVGRLVGAL